MNNFPPVLSAFWLKCVQIEIIRLEESKRHSFQNRFLATFTEIRSGQRVRLSRTKI